ncbi:hypothetical protein BLNAU_6052 [Blattamonas nauphoetae]|uniref:Uncharacterized protein n=1 Tax=Blattamonas nauphoetae TaxID=2049346 RepID=A0ABQ9Y5K7_9EUKA|nr:hypothetical protein BLNAU_6052 [Blattamonas nauphoetae]
MTSSHLKQQSHPDCQVSLSQSMIGTAVSSSTNHLYGTAILDMNSGGSLLCQNSSFLTCLTFLSHRTPPSTNQADQTEIPTLRFYRDTFKGLSSTSNGGAIYSNRKDTHVLIKECSFDSCTGNYGGACYLRTTYDSTSLTSLDSSSFVGCLASYGGSVYFDVNTRVSITGCVFLDTLAHYHGGAVGISMDTGTAVQNALSNCLFQNCSQTYSNSTLGGGAILVSRCATLTLSHLQFRQCWSIKKVGHAIYMFDTAEPSINTYTVFECYSQSTFTTNLVHYPISPSDRTTTIGDAADLIVTVDRAVEGQLLVLLSNVAGGRQPGSSGIPNIARLVTFDLSSSMTGSCSVQIGETGLLQRPLNDYEVTAASLSGHNMSFDGVKIPIPRTLESVECTLDEGQSSPTISFRGENFPDGQYKVILHDKSFIEVEFSTDTDGSLIASCHLDEVGDGTKWKEGSVWVVTGVECVDDPSIRVIVEKTLYFTIPVLPSEVTGVGSPSLNKKKTEVSFEIVGSGFPLLITSVSLKRGERTITSSSATMISSTSISATFAASFTEDDNSCKFGETYTLDSIATSKTITVPSDTDITIPSPPTITSITADPSSSPNEFVLKVEGTNLPANEVFLAQIDSFAPIRVTMSGDGTSGESDAIRAGQSHTIQFDTSYTVKTLRKEGDEDEHILLTSSTFTTPLGPTLTSISCPLSASDPNFVVLTVGGDRLPDGQYFVVVQKVTDQPIKIEIAIASNSGMKTLLAFGSGVLEYSGVYAVKRMWSESVEVSVDDDASFTVGPAPARIESALCVLSVESEKKTAKLTLSGSNLPLNKPITIEVKPLSSDGQIVGSPVQLDCSAASTVSTIIIDIDMYADQSNLVFGTKYEVTSLVIDGTPSVLTPKIQFSVPIEPVRVKGVSVVNTITTTQVKISGSGFIVDETYKVEVSGTPSNGGSGSSHPQTITVVASDTKNAASSSIVLGTSESAVLRFGYSYTINSITNGKDDGFVEGTITFETPLGPTLTSISCPLSASDPNFVDLTVGGERLADGQYSLLLQKGSEPSFKVEIQITSNTGVESLPAFGSGVLKYSGVYDVNRMWSESVEVKVDDVASFTVGPAPARIESASCVLSVESEKKEAKLTLTGSSLPVDKAIKIEVKPFSSNGQILGSPVQLDCSTAESSAIVITIDMYSTQPKLEFGTKYEVTSLVIDGTPSVLTPKIQFSVPIEPVRVKGVSVVNTITTTQVKISGSGFIVDETYKVEVSGTPSNGGSGSSHSQTVTVVASDAMNAASSVIILGTSESAVLRFGYMYTIKSIKTGKDDGFVEGTITFETPLGPTLTSISCPLSASDPNFVVLTVGGLRMIDGQYFVVVQKDSDQPITIEVPITSNLGMKSLLAFGSGVLEYSGVYAVKRMWSESVEVLVDSGASSFTVDPAPARIESASCVLSGDSESEATLKLSGSNLPLNTEITLKVTQLSSDGHLVGSPIQFDPSKAVNTSALIIDVDMYAPHPKVSFGTKYEVTSVVIGGTSSVLTPNIHFSVPIEPVRVDGVSVVNTITTTQVKISGTGFIATETYTIEVSGIPSDGGSGSSHGQTITVVASTSLLATSSVIILGNDESAVLRFGYTYTIKSIKTGKDDGFVEGTITFETPLGPTLTSISCPLSASDPNFVVLTVGGLRMIDGQYFVVDQKDSDQPITIEVPITSNLGMKSLLAFGSGVLEYSGVYAVKRMWSESVEVLVDSGASSFTVDPAPARIESASCVLSGDSESEATLKLSGSNLPLNTEITLKVTQLSSDGHLVGSPIQFDPSKAVNTSALIIDVDMYAPHPKVSFGTKYEVTSVVIGGTSSVLTPNIHFSVPIEPVRVDGVSVVNTITTTQVKISGTGFIATETYTIEVSGIPSDGGSGSSHGQTITVVASTSLLATSSVIILGNDESAVLRFGYTYTIKSIKTGKDDGFVEGTITFETPLGPTLTSISCPLSASDPNFVVLTVGGLRMIDGQYFVVVQKDSDQPITIEVPITSNLGMKSLLAFGSGVLEYSGVYAVKRMWSESVEVLVDSGASSFTVDPAPARIESASCVLSGDSESEATLKLSGSNLPLNTDITIKVTQLTSDGHLVGTPIQFDPSKAVDASTLIITIEMYADQSKLSFGTKYEVTSLEIDTTPSVLTPKIQFSVPIEPVRVTGVSVDNTITTTQVKISGSGFIVDETYKMEVSGTPSNGGTGASHGQTITVVASTSLLATSSVIILGNDESAVLRFGYTYTIKSITNGTEDGYVEGTPTFDTPSFSPDQPQILSASVETNGQKTRMWIVLSGSNLLQDSRFTLTLNNNMKIDGVMYTEANEWSICTSCPIQGRVVVQPLSLKTTVCSSEFLGSWETLSTALNEDPIIQTVIETASGKKDPKPASSFSQPFSSFSTPDFMKPTQPSVWKAPLSASPPIARQCLVLQTVPPRCLLPPRLRQSFSSQIPTPHPVADFWSCTDLVCLQPDLRPSANIPLQKNSVAPNYVGSFVGTCQTCPGSYPFILHDDFMNEYGVLNVRLKEAWYLPMTEITTLSSEFLIEGILVNSLLLCGASFQNNLAELMPKDSDGSLRVRKLSSPTNANPADTVNQLSIRHSFAKRDNGTADRRYCDHRQPPTSPCPTVALQVNQTEHYPEDEVLHSHTHFSF